MLGMSAVCEYLEPVVTMDLEEHSSLHPMDFLVQATITVYWHPNSDWEDVYDTSRALKMCNEAKDGNTDRAVKVCEIDVVTILGRQLALLGGDVYDLCDFYHSALEYAAAALEQAGEDVQDNILYIDSLEMEDGFEAENIKMFILDELPYMCLRFFGVIPKIIAYYPLPLDDDDAQQTADLTTQQEKPKQMVLTTDSFVCKETVKGEEHMKVVSPNRMHTLDEIYFLPGRMQHGAPYPETAKDHKDIAAYEACGFEEAGNSRLYYKFFTPKECFG